MKALTDTWLLKQRLDRVIFLLLIVFLPSQFGYHFWPKWAFVSGIRIDYFSPTVLFTDILVFLILVLNARAVLPFLRRMSVKKNLICLGICVFLIINLLYSINFSVSLYSSIKLLEFLFLGWWVFSNRKFVLSSISVPLTIALLYTFLLGLFQVFTGRTLGGLTYLLGERSFSISTPGIALARVFDRNFLRPYASFPHPNVLAGFSVVSFFIIETTGKKGALKSLGLLLAAANIFLSFSLGAIIAFLVGVFVLVFRLTGLLAKTYRQIVLAFVFVSLLLMPLSQKLLFLDFNFSENVANRLRLANIAGETIVKNPLLGVGLGNFISYIPNSSINSTLWLLQPVHNSVDLIVSELGYVGLAIVVLFVLSLSLKKEPKKLLLVLPILITGLFDHYWLTLPQTTLLLAVVVGILF